MKINTGLDMKSTITMYPQISKFRKWLAGRVLFYKAKGVCNRTLKKFIKKFNDEFYEERRLIKVLCLGLCYGFGNNNFKNNIKL